MQGRARNRKPVQILLVEDNEIDVQAVRRSLKKAKLPHRLTVVANGVEALEALRGKDDAPGLPRPILVLLDLAMPLMDGHEFLAELRADSTLHDIPVFVLTTSSAEGDVKRAYERHVAGYIVKEDLTDLFHRAMSLLEEYATLSRFP